MFIIVPIQGDIVFYVINIWEAIALAFDFCTSHFKEIIDVHGTGWFQCLWASRTCLIIMAAALCISAVCAPCCMINTMNIWHNWNWASSNQHLKSKSSLPSSASKFAVTKPLVYNFTAYDGDSSHPVLRRKFSIGREKHFCSSHRVNWTKGAEVVRR